MKTDGNKVVVSEELLYKCFEYIWIKIISMIIWRTEGEKTDFSAIIAGVDRVFDRSSATQNRYFDIVKEYNLDNEANMLMLALF